MAKLSGLSERSFKRRFAKATGMTPMEYVQTVRLEEAKQILETTDAPVDYILGEEPFLLDDPMTLVLGPDESIPEAVNENEQGYLMVSESPVNLAMLNAIKQLKCEVEEFAF